MSMDRVAWSSLYNITRASSGSKPFSKETLKRVFSFARPHRGKLIAFVLLSVVMAFLAVATPVLAGQVVDAIVAQRGRRQRSSGSPSSSPSWPWPRPGWAS